MNPVPAIPIQTSTPTRICDLGGWTDTWFAEFGAVCHLAVWPGVDVRLQADAESPGVTVRVGGEPCGWTWRPGRSAHEWPNPLIAATLDEACPPARMSLALDVTSRVPPGASMGTSAATCVAVLAAFDRLDGVSRAASEQAVRAHAVETERLGWQSGVQDQYAPAPGTGHLVIVDRYPHSMCRTLLLVDGVVAALDDALLVVFLGRAHASTAIHEQVVGALQHAGPHDPRLTRLRALAHEGARALEAGDLRAYAGCLTTNTDVQRLLHRDLVSPDADAIIGVARDAGASGWKVNGAGGDGGTVTILCADRDHRQYLARVIPAAVAGTHVLPITLATGDRRVW